MVRPLKILLSKVPIVALFVLYAGLSVAHAQYGQPPHYHQLQDSSPHAHQSPAYRSSTQAESYGAYQPVATNSVDQLYQSNAARPLGGLFAKGFTRTLTVLGGWNFANSLESDSTIFDPLPGAPPFPGSFNDPETGYAISFAFGRRHSHKLRSEIELAIRENESSSIRPQVSTAGNLVGNQDDVLRGYSVMKNFIFDFENQTRLTPYVGTGLGWTYLDVEAPSSGIDEGVGAFSYQAIGGVATKLNKAADFIVEYRFLGTSEVELDNSPFPITYQAHNLLFGVKFEY